MLLELESGDILIVPELSRLGRTPLGVLEVVKACREKGVAVYAVKGSWSLNDTLESKILLSVFSMIAEIERDLISSRTKEALKAKRAAGIMLGRPKGPGKSKLDPNREEIVALIKTGVPKTKVAKKYGVSVSNLDAYLRRRNLLKEASPR